MREILVEASAYRFEPNAISVKRGERIRLKVTSKDVFHTFTVDELGIDLSLSAGAMVTREFVAEKTGTFVLYCKPHRALGMVGTLAVANNGSPADQTPVPATPIPGGVDYSY